MKPIIKPTNSQNCDISPLHAVLKISGYTILSSMAFLSIYVCDSANIVYVECKTKQMPNKKASYLTTGTALYNYLAGILYSAAPPSIFSFSAASSSISPSVVFSIEGVAIVSLFGLLALLSPSFFVPFCSSSKIRL